MANFPNGGSAVPSVYTDISTVSSGVSLASNGRIATLLGEGARRETLISTALGKGADGWNDSFTSSAGAVGRFFKLTYFPVISNRTSLYKNGILLSGIEGVIDGSTINSNFDYKIDPATGEIELIPASLVDQGGAYYSASSANTGDGYLSALTLLDSNALNETWSIRCSSVNRNGLGQPISGTAKFIAVGSVSGVLLDGYGQVISWQSNGTVTSNTVLSFAIFDGATVFTEGDKFTVQVKSGVLSTGNSLSAT